MMEVVLMLVGVEAGNPNWAVVVLGNLICSGMGGPDRWYPGNLASGILRVIQPFLPWYLAAHSGPYGKV